MTNTDHDGHMTLPWVPTDAARSLLHPVSEPCAVSISRAQLDQVLTPSEFIMGARRGRGHARMKMHYMALQMIAGGSTLDTPIIMLDPKGGDSVKTTVGRLLIP